MKTRYFQSCSLGLALSVLPFVAGCNQQPGGSPQSLVSQALAEPAVQSSNSVSTSSPVINDSETAPPPPAEKTIPPSIKPSAPLAEIIKLANAGVEENVMLACVNSSQSAFNLGSDEIIYLNDLGVPDNVVTAMIERDQVLKQPWSPPTPTAVAPAEVANGPAPENQEQPVAAAPTYVNPQEFYPVEQPAQVNYNYFYSNLSPYGSWANLDGYGWCWQPTVVNLNHNWQPYCDRGRWVNTDCGWYWQSDYSWGLTFHYGRWFNHPSRGWCWWPERNWGPAWVTWRQNNDFCGWAPLPPRSYYRPGFGLTYFNGRVGVSFDFGLNASCFTFVPWRGFCDSRPFRHRVNGAQATTVFNNTTVINNIIRGNNNTIINRGIAPERVTEITRTPVRQVPVRDAQTRIAATRFNERAGRGSLTPDRSHRDRPDGISNRTFPARNEAANNSTQRDGQSSVFAPATRGQDRSEMISPRSTERSNTETKSGRDNNASQDARSDVRHHASAPWINHGSNSSRQTPASVPPTAPSDSLSVTGNRNDAHPNDQNRFTPPSTRNNSETVQPSSAQKRSPNSLIVIGQSNNAQPRGQIRVVEPVGRTSAENQLRQAAPYVGRREPVASAPEAEPQSPNLTRTWSQPPAQVQRQENSCFVQQPGNRFEKSPSGPVVQPNFAPSAPQQFNPAPAPAPRSAPVFLAPQPRVESQRAANPRVESAPPSSSSQHFLGHDRSDDDGGGRRGR